MMGSMLAVDGQDWHTEVLLEQLKRLQRSIFVLAVCAKVLSLIRQKGVRILQSVKPAVLASAAIRRLFCII